MRVDAQAGNRPIRRSRVRARVMRTSDGQRARPARPPLRTPVQLAHDVPACGAALGGLPQRPGVRALPPAKCADGGNSSVRQRYASRSEIDAGATRRAWVTAPVLLSHARLRLSSMLIVALVL